MSTESAFTNTALEEYVTLEYILLGDLRDLLEEPADEQTRKWLSAVLDALLETLPREFELRCEGGYLSEVLEIFPNWYHEVDRLHRERDALYESLGRLRVEVQADVPFLEAAAHVRDGLREWMTAFTAHRRHERRLLQNAWTMDVGAGD